MSVANGSVWMVGVLLVGVWTFHPDVGSAAGQPSTTKSIVVAELFTSEGCSSALSPDEHLWSTNASMLVDPARNPATLQIISSSRNVRAAASSAPALRV
jgi:hypothetical protein